MTALGTVRTGMVGNDQEWMNRFFKVATEAHEKIWQLRLMKNMKACSKAA